MSQARVVSRTASANEARACYDLLTQAQTYLQRAKVCCCFSMHSHHFCLHYKKLIILLCKYITLKF